MNRQEAITRIIASNLDVAKYNRNPLRLEKHACATLELKPHEAIDSPLWSAEYPRRGGRGVRELDNIEDVKKHVHDLVFMQSYHLASHPIKVMFTERASGKILYKNKDGELTRGNKECYFIVGTLDVATCDTLFYSEFIPTYEAYKDAPAQDALEVYMTLQDLVEFGVTVEEYERKGRRQ